MITLKIDLQPMKRDQEEEGDDKCLRNNIFGKKRELSKTCKGQCGGVGKAEEFRKEESGGERTRKEESGEERTEEIQVGWRGRRDGLGLRRWCDRNMR